MHRITASLTFAVAIVLGLAAGAPAGEPIANGDVNGNGQRDISDVIYLLMYLYRNGPEPVPIVCGDPGGGMTNDPGAPGDEKDAPNPYIQIPPGEFFPRLLRAHLLASRPAFQPRVDPAHDLLEPDGFPTTGIMGAGGGGGDAHRAGLEGDQADDYCELENYFVLETGSSRNAGSNVAAIELWLGDFLVYLNAPEGGFQPDQVLVYDFNSSSCPACWNTMSPDDWDSVRLATRSHDGIQVSHVEMVHSDQLVLEADPGAWLDEYYGAVLDFSVDTALTRWERIGETRITALYYAAQDLGQTGESKYVGVDVAWCSEFASWAIRQTGLDTPAGSISTTSLSNYFAGAGR